MAHLADAKAEELLNQTKIKEITTTRKLITLRADDSISAALQTLANNAITSAPVWDAEKKGFIGFVDVLDLAMFVSYTFYENYKKHPHLYDPKEIQKRFQTTVSELINVSKRDPFWPINGNESVAFLIDNFLKVGIHRVPVVDDGEVIGVVSQSDVVRLLSKNIPTISQTANKTISELGLNTNFVVTIKNDATLIEAFNLILTSGVSGIAVVNFSDGSLINNLSASDMRGLTEQSFFRLEVQLHQLFAGISKMPPVTCRPNAHLSDVLKQIESTGVHRVYIVDDHNRPTGVIALTDILRLFSRPGNPLDI